MGRRSGAHSWRRGSCVACGCRQAWALADRPCPMGGKVTGRVRRPSAPAASLAYPPELPPIVEASGPPLAVALTAAQQRAFDSIAAAASETGRALTVEEARVALGLPHTRRVHDLKRTRVWASLLAIGPTHVQLRHVRVELRTRKPQPKKPRPPRSPEQRRADALRTAARRAAMTPDARREEWLRHQRARRSRARAAA